MNWISSAMRDIICYEGYETTCHLTRKSTTYHLETQNWLEMSVKYHTHKNSLSLAMYEILSKKRLEVYEAPASC